MHRLFQNLHHAFRLMSRAPGFAAVAVITLALGIGANTAIFSVVYATLLAPLPYPKPDQLVMVWSKFKGARNIVSAGDFLDWKNQNTVFQDLAASRNATFNLATSERPEEIQGRRTTPGFFNILGVKFAMGRDFMPDEGQPGRDHEVILSNKLWQRLGARPDIIGQPLRMDGESYTIIGVMSPGVTDRGQSQLAVPLAFQPAQINHDSHWLQVMGRLKPGVTLKQAQAEMDVITARIAKEHPDSNATWGARVELLKNDFLSRQTANALWLLLVSVGFVLLIACANVANLLLAKGATRFKEVAMRSSLGATRGSIFAQFLTESLALSALGGAVGLLFGLGMMKILTSAMPPFTLPAEADVQLSVPVLLFTFIVTMVAGALFGCAPAWQASRVDLNGILKQGGGSGTAAGRHYARRLLVVSEFGLALTLLIGAGVSLHSFFNLSHFDLGVRTDHVLTFGFPVPRSRLSQPEQMITFYRQLVQELDAIPGVQHAGIATGLPLAGPSFVEPFNIAGQPAASGAPPNAAFLMVTPGYFQTFGIQMEQGRSFNEQDTEASPRVAVVSENFVKNYFSGINPLGKQVIVKQLIPGVAQHGPPLEWEIVGVFRNVRYGDPRDLRYAEFPEIDVPFDQSPWPNVDVAVQTMGDPVSMTKAVAAAANSIESEVALTDMMSMQQMVAQSFVNDRFLSSLYWSFAAIALVLATVGIYGVMSFSVAQRTQEIGVRMALGATRKQLLLLILREGLALALAGLVLGMLGAVLVGSAMRGMLYGVSPVDASVFSVAAVLLFGAAILACYIPARRAMKVDPMVALRYQ